MTPVARVGLALDPATNDLFLTASGDLALATDAQAVSQHAKQRLMTFQGEWFLDTTAGVPWIEEILGKRPALTLAEGVIKAEILDTDGVTAINEFAIRFRAGDRRLDVPKANISTEYDEDQPL
ncbi:hypothetical protein D3218_13130 [Aureimonas flava]|uniref:Uncharacterized protein n=1 Tax=Aureimonas flava TaxID=2320271 RepID=A0A3A1WJV6_9HYPH|nr:hypothetical protein [Aureimonas flava]RIY00222.1 hypothetical protein D3218_13130 [Aureimonas flava]